MILQRIVAALNSDEAVGEVINIGSNFEISISDTAFLIAKILNKKIKLMSDTERLRPTKSEVERLLADTQKAEKILSWRPKYAGRSGFEVGLTETLHWFSDKNNIKNYKLDSYNF